MSTANGWPALRVSDWEPTRDTLHMWTQIVGKIRLTHSPLLNHWWQVTLYVSPRGLTTGSIPYGNRLFDLEFDFVDHVLAIRTSDGGSATVALAPNRSPSSTPKSFPRWDNWESKRASPHGPTKSTRRSPSPRITSTRPTTRRPRSCSGANWSRRTA